MAAEAGHLDRSACAIFLQMAATVQATNTQIAELEHSVGGLETIVNQSILTTSDAPSTTTPPTENQVEDDSSS